MANILLGLTAGAAILLPPIRWSGADPSFPIDYTKQVDKSTMLSGQPRFNFRSKHPRRWILSWEMLTLDELEDLIDLNEYNVPLYYFNGWEDIGARSVVMTSFNYGPHVRTGGCWADVYYGDPLYGAPFYATSPRYSASLMLEEVL